MFLFVLCTIVQADYSKWMSFVNDDLYFTDILIPGSYQSINKTVQELSIQDQLSSGIRFFDITITQESIYQFNTFQETLINFLNENPTEFLILYMYHNLSSDMLNNSINWHYYNNNIIKIRNIRGKIYPLFSNTSITMFDNQSKVSNVETYIIQNYNITHITFALHINNLLLFFIKSYNSKLTGVIATDSMNRELSYAIFTKNQLQVNMYLEIIITLIISGLIYVSCCIIKLFTNFQCVNLFISCVNTTVHIFWIYYYYKIATYINYNVLMTAYVSCTILIVLFSVLIFFNLILLIPEIIEHNVEKYITNRVIKCDSKLFVLLTIYGNCNFLFRISYITYNGTDTKICKEHKFCMSIMMFVLILILLWDIITFFCIDYIFVKSSLLLLCTSIVFLNILMNTYQYYIISLGLK